jgi:hypothetical protein
MGYKHEFPFDSIESSHEFVALLSETIEDVRSEIIAEITRATEEGNSSHRETLPLVSYNLSKLDMHITSSRKILKDMLFLRRLLLTEEQAQTCL